jgi:hypothetical protein
VGPSTSATYEELTPEHK